MTSGPLTAQTILMPRSNLTTIAVLDVHFKDAIGDNTREAILKECYEAQSRIEKLAKNVGVSIDFGER